MQYMLLICGYVDDVVAPEDQAVYTIEDWVSEMDGRGVRLTGNRLRPRVLRSLWSHHLALFPRTPLRPRLGGHTSGRERRASGATHQIG